MKPVKPGSCMIIERPVGVAWRLLVLVVLCMILGSICTVRLHNIFNPIDGYDPRVETACKTPTHEGQMTVQVIYMGKHVCWRWS